MSAEFLENVVSRSGRAVAWLTIAMVLLTFAIVLMRYGFNLGWIWFQESVSYLHATVFMVAAAWALQEDAHVRVDVFYRNASPRRQAWVNLLGTLLLLMPVCIFLLVTGWDYVIRSWQVLEGSREAGGLPLVFLLKTLILVLPGLLMIQAIANVRRHWSNIRLLPGSQGGR